MRGSIRDRLVRLLGRGESNAPAPDALVELENVWLHEGPRLLQVLERAGVEAQGVESTDVAVEAAATTRMRIFVRYADVSRAATALDEHRRQPRST